MAAVLARIVDDDLRARGIMPCPGGELALNQVTRSSISDRSNFSPVRQPALVHKARHDSSTRQGMIPRATQQTACPADALSDASFLPALAKSGVIIPRGFECQQHTLA